jgi:hypothetical protein
MCGIRPNLPRVLSPTQKVYQDNLFVAIFLADRLQVLWIPACAGMTPWWGAAGTPRRIFDDTPALPAQTLFRKTFEGGSS